MTISGTAVQDLEFKELPVVSAFLILSTKLLDLSRTQVIISGTEGSGVFDAAAVRELLVYSGRLFIYCSALSITHRHVQKVKITGENSRRIMCDADRTYCDRW